MSGHKTWALAIAAFGVSVSAFGQAWISEILFAPPGSDLPNQYIELRGPPNFTFRGTYFIAVQGDNNGNPGVIENVFDLSGCAVGGNGFLVLLQKSNTYAISPNAGSLVNAGSGTGFGSGSSSSIGHIGRQGRTDLPHASVTFLLIQTTNAPAPGIDIDANNDGAVDSWVPASWTILDSVGVAQNAGDIAYGAINFSKNSGAIASGTVVPVSFTPGYLGRTGNTTNSDAAAWVAGGSLGGAAPDWILSSTRTVPPEFANLALNHLGLPNFGANSLPGVVAIPTGGSTDVLEGDGTDSYLLGLNTAPTGTVVIQVTAAGQTQVSIDGGTNFFSSCALNVSDTLMRAVTVRALADNIIETSPHTGLIHHRVISTADPTEYPLSALGPDVRVNIFEQESLLLNELKVNPPGTNDAPCEFVEIKGPPGALLRDVCFLGIDGDHTRNPGEVKLSINLGGVVLGSSGLLVIAASGNPYTIPPTTTVLIDSRFNGAGGALKNNAMSFLLVSSPAQIDEGTDLDAGNNGTLEGLPPGTTFLDAAGWQGGSTNDIVYGGVSLSGVAMPPDAIGRFPTNTAPLNAGAWYFGELAGTNCDSLVFDSTAVSSNFPSGVILSPGAENSIDVQIAAPGPLSGVIGDATNPGLSFQVSANGSNPDAVLVTASSSDPEVVPDHNLLVLSGPNGQRTLYLNPASVGYTTITLTAVAGNHVGQVAFPYAASAMGRPGGIWHTGTSDGSTAIAVDPDLMFVGDNENNVIRLYNRHRSGAPVNEFDFQLDLGLTPEEHGEVNIEGSTRCGNRLYFIGAHSNANSGVTRTNRNRIFAVDLSGSGTNSALSYIGRYDFLKVDLINWDSTNGHGKGSNYYGFAASAADNVNPKAPDGFNIEGLSMAPGSTNSAWIGFRAPIVPVTNRTYALIVPVLNFANLAVSGGSSGSAVFGVPIEIDLYGRGIRSLEGTTNGYLISGGPPGDVRTYPNDFRLYTWTGNPADQPIQRGVDLTGMHPEGIAELPPLPWNEDSQIQLISDNGAMIPYNDGIQNKHLLINAFKKFRSDRVLLGPSVKPAPIITSSVAGADNLTLTWRALKGETYRVQFKHKLADPDWTDASADIIASSPFASAVLPRILQDQGHYRVMLVVP